MGLNSKNVTEDYLQENISKFGRNNNNDNDKTDDPRNFLRNITP